MRNADQASHTFQLLVCVFTEAYSCSTLSDIIKPVCWSLMLYLVLPQVGKLADLVLWKPAFFGAKPEMVIKGGVIAWANMGDPNASIPTPEPVNSFHQ